ncbi:nanoRNase/pAp phosphatase, hydrolyzes c-di-AMP and oligoRNAs [Halomicrobium zhouii]|uniref:NanoRNase/pAp phosphatase, hydrolyzes c-di-AMP and oligoRNAs n=1 Tax=Halomicrobium zhouii TaxID=767519 RepID=A0A1I6KT00_9EURY|nr:DHH family phosphoesterase [Halomicrobium zhouii]SFR94362.1 nanoRNase/pAp phosphatase, hydrolyzes c-di-AMP and oligoRNAs [Halomicrobium zhouii]
MTSRLVLGTGPLGRRLLSALEDQRGDLLVVTDDEHRVDTLRSGGIRVVPGDPSDRETLRDLGADPDSVLITAEDGETNLRAARAVDTVFPESMVLAYAGRNPTPETSAALATVADQVVDPGNVVAEELSHSIGDGGLQVRQLQRVLRDVDGRLAVVTHDNPDPDAIASAVTLARIAEAVGCETDVCYYGEISHQENRAFVNLLEFDLHNLDDESDLSEYDGFALVDHSRPGVNDQLPHETEIDVVIDHHPPRAPIEARFVDLRSDVGATSTLLVDYVRRLGGDVDQTVATGLLFGIRVDTKEFRREVSPDDFEAAAFLLPHADMEALQRIEQPSITAETLQTVGRAIQNRREEGSVLLSCVGELSDRDALAQAADRLLTLEDVNATLVYGVQDGTIYVSARARGTDIDLGETLRDAFGQIGSAGGHADMAGAQITLGVLDTIEDRDESLHEVVRAVVDDRFLETLQGNSDRLLTSVYGPETFESDRESLEEVTEE